MSDRSPKPTDSAVADARLTEITVRFGDQLSAEQLQQVRARTERALSLASQLRRTPLTNADEPEIVFVPYRGDDSA